MARWCLEPSQSVISQLSFKLVKFFGLLLADFVSEFLSPKRIRYVEEPRGTWWARNPPPPQKNYYLRKNFKDNANCFS